MGYFSNAGVILIEALFGLVALLFVLRALLQLVRANFHNPVCQFFYKATNPVLMPLRRWLPPWRGFDIAASLVAMLVLCLKVWLLGALLGRWFGPLPLLVLGVAELVSFLLGLYFWLTLVRVILSFVGPSGHHPVVPLIAQLTEPVLRPVRRVLPALGGFDLSPLLLMLGIALARALVVAPLRDLGVLLAQ